MNDDDDESDYQYILYAGTAHIVKYNGYGGHVIVPSTLGGCPVTIIGHSAFASDGSITSVNLPESLLTLGDMAFYDCHGITSVIMPKGIVYIGSSVFSGCNLIEEIDLPASVTTIGNYVLSGRTTTPTDALLLAEKDLQRSLQDFKDALGGAIRLKGNTTVGGTKPA